MKLNKIKVAGQKGYESLRRKIIRLSVTSFLLSFISLAIVGTQLFYPFHVVIGLGIYILSYIPFVRRIYLSRKVWQEHKTYTYAKSFLGREKRVIVISLLTLLTILILITVRPLDGGEFNNLSDTEVAVQVTDDLYQSITAMDYLETTAQQLVTSLQTDVEDTNVAEQIENKFTNFLQAVTYSESITDRNKYFANIPYRLWDERVQSFMISYSLYVKKYELLHRVLLEASGSEYKKKLLNQFVPMYEQDKIYAEMVARFYAPKTKLRINGGYWYLKLFANNKNEYGGEYEVLSVKANEGYEYLFKNFDKTLLKTGEVVVDSARNKMFSMWFPVQRSIANTMGRVVISGRGKTHLITEELIHDMQVEMLPGDIMLQRRNWYLSNVGIPGFWTHAALYTGTLENMNEYFATEFPYAGYQNFTAYLEQEFPLVYSDYSILDEQSNQKSVIEAIEPGVVLTTLEVSVYADFVSVLRPRLTKQDKMLALFKAFSNYHKPYDYNFDFDTRDALVCSELIYDAYFERQPDKGGIQFGVSFINGRKMVSPLDMANKYQNEFGTPKAQLEFVYFLRTYNEENVARSATETEFLESVDWNKFSFLQE